MPDSRVPCAKLSLPESNSSLLLPAAFGFVNWIECFFVSHFWRSQEPVDLEDEYLRRVQSDSQVYSVFNADEDIQEVGKGFGILQSNRT